MVKKNNGIEDTITEKVTASLCPVCLKKIPASLVREPDRPGVWMRKSCPEHGFFETPVWKDRISLKEWTAREEPLSDSEKDMCTGDCRACRSCGNPHGQDTCCVILEVTKRCNLCCPYCFARGGESAAEPSFEELCRAIDIIAEKGKGPLIQFAGGEPTLRDDLPELLRYAKKAGCSYTQVNTNGIRLAEDGEYAGKLAEAGIDIVFLQFDGTDDAVYEALRGRKLLAVKEQAIRNCERHHIGVTLVPTIVRGVNEQKIGEIVRYAVRLYPAVRSVHFQPVTYLGRFPEETTFSGNGFPEHYTLDELMADLCKETGIPENALLPSCCDHAMCEFHATFLVNENHQLIPTTDRGSDQREGRTPAAKNRAYVAEHWKYTPGTAFTGMLMQETLPLVTSWNRMSFDDFIRLKRTRTMKISAMAFQDASNIDLERLYRCSLHVYEDGMLLPFCGKYLTPMPEKGLY